MLVCQRTAVRIDRVDTDDIVGLPRTDQVNLEQRARFAFDRECRERAGELIDTVEHIKLRMQRQMARSRAGAAGRACARRFR